MSQKLNPVLARLLMRAGRDDLPCELHTAAACRELDRRAIADTGLPGYSLMCRAGQAAFALLRERWPEASRVLVLAGPGNNGGDGYVVAHLAHSMGMTVELLQVGDHGNLGGEAQQAWSDAFAAGVRMRPWDGEALPGADVVVDALLGTGLRVAPRAPFDAAIAAINASRRPVLALDLPSGLSADTGHAPGAAVQAQATITFIALKQGLLTGRGPALSGELHFDDLEVPSEVLTALAPDSLRLDAAKRELPLAPRARDGHKGDYGHVLVVGGDHGFGGAVLMVAEAAGRVGAGLVTVATQAEHVGALLARRPETMARAVNGAAGLAPLLERASVVVLGPGLGRSAWSRELYAAVLASDKPVVLDADGLNLLAEQPVQRDNWIFTPHPGEAARLLGRTTDEVQADRFTAVRDLVAQFGGTAVLKGSGTLVASADRPVAVCGYGNPGMASGGMGDVLAGVIGGLLAQRLPLAAELGVMLHALAADACAMEDGERGLSATDLLPWLRRLVNP